MFHLRMGADTLLGVVPSSGPVHWGALAIAHVLQYRAVYQFSHSRHTMPLKDLPTLQPATLKEGKLRFISHSRMLSVLKRSKSPYVQELLKDLKHLDFPATRTQKKNSPYPIFQRCADGAPYSKSLLRWLEEYKHYLLTRIDRSPSPEPPPALTAVDSLPPRKRARFLSATGSSTPPPPVLSPESLPTPLPRSPSQPPPPPRSPLQPPPPRPPPPPQNSVSSPVPYGSAIYSPTVSPYPPSPSPEPSRTSSPGPLEAVNEPAVPERRASIGGFTLWMDQIPPTKIFLFHGNHSRTFVEKWD